MSDTIDETRLSLILNELRMPAIKHVWQQFAARSNRVISAGRPPCPLCDEPLDPEGHICVRTNGYRRGAWTGSDDDDADD